MIRKLALHFKKTLEFSALSGVIFAAFIILGWLIQGSIGLERTLLNERFYLELIEKFNIHNQVITYLENRFGEERDEILVDDSLFYQALNEAVNEDWIKRQAELLITETLLFAKGKRQRLLLAVDLHDREELFRAALLEGLLENAPTRLPQLKLTEELLREFTRQIDFPDRIVLVNLTFDELPAVYQRALHTLRLSRAVLNPLIVLLVITLTILGLVMIKAAGTIKITGAALICSALSFQLFMSAARLYMVEPLAQKISNMHLAAVLPGDASTLFKSALRVAAPELNQVSLGCLAAGLGLLALYFILKPASRQRFLRILNR